MSLFAALQVSASGLGAQRTRAEMLVENMANAETTRTPEGGPYKRKDVVFATQVQASPFSAVFQNELATGVTVDRIVEDTREPERRYQPGHPDADSNGYVAFPRLNPAEEMVRGEGHA
jgi:flagellar basal-body rod protein FlgC